MIDDPFLGQFGPDSTGDRFFAITPDDSADLAIRPRYLHCGGQGGTVVLVDAGGAEATFRVEQAGYVGARPTRVKATGTTATGLVGVY